jgi:hypothetical protein
MGVTISHRLKTSKPYVKPILDRAEQVAKYYQEEAERRKIDFSIRRLSEKDLLIDVGNCETLCFEFKSAKEITKEHEAEGWSYLWAVLTNDGKTELDAGYKIEDFPHNEKFYCSSFCKTQFCRDLWEHKAVADIIRVVASYCEEARVNDEGDYYYTSELKDASRAIGDNGRLIDNLGEQLKASGFNVIKGGNERP